MRRSSLPRLALHRPGLGDALALAVDREVAQRADGDAEPAGQLVLGLPRRQAVVRELLEIGDERAVIAIRRAERAREQPDALVHGDDRRRLLGGPPSRRL